MIPYVREPKVYTRKLLDSRNLFIKVTRYKINENQEPSYFQQTVFPEKKSSINPVNEVKCIYCELLNTEEKKCKRHQKMN